MPFAEKGKLFHRGRFFKLRIKLCNLPSFISDRPHREGVAQFHRDDIILTVNFNLLYVMSLHAASLHFNSQFSIQLKNE